MLKAVPVLALLATMGAAAQAQSYEQLERWCHDDNATDDQTIQGCSAVITSGRATGKDLFKAFYDRGLSFLNTNQFDRAIEDFDKAISLDPNDADAFNARVSRDNHSWIRIVTPNGAINAATTRVQ